MSYDVQFNIGTGAPEPHCVAAFNFTSNCAPMFRKAFGDAGLHRLHGKGAQYAAPLIRSAMGHMERNKGQYETLNPANGWGDINAAFLFLQALHAQAVLHKNCIITVSC